MTANFAKVGVCQMLFATDVWSFPMMTCFYFQVIEIEDASPLKCPITTKLVLDEDEETKEPLVQVHRSIVTRLKPHQVDGKKKELKIIFGGEFLLFFFSPPLQPESVS